MAFFTVLFLWQNPVDSQNGDRAGEAQPENWREWEVPPAPPLSPEEQLRSFRVAPGFRVELVAADPLIVDPITIDFDEHGRLWAIELRAYMPNVDGEGECDPLGTVVVLDDLDGDGTYDRRNEFLTGLVNPRALALVDGGVLVGEPPYLWYCRDVDGDLRSDWKMEITRFGSPNPDHLEHTENGLLRNLDNWLYCAKSSRRFKFFRGEDDVPYVKEEPTAFRGQWGIASDAQGRLHYNGNSSYLYGDPWPAEYLLRGSVCGRAIGQSPGIGERLVDDEAVFSIRVNPGINRGYQPGMLREDGRLARTTSVSGLAIERGGCFPAEYHGDAFIPEPAGNVVANFRSKNHRRELQRTQRLFPDEDWGSRAFLASSDERFRPVDCAFGPEGALYVVDLYRGILQHRQYVTSYLRSQILERGLDRPVGLGRIWRVVPENWSPPKQTLDQHFRDLPACVRSLSHESGWIREVAQRKLIEANDPTIVPLLNAKVSSGPTIGRIHALWTLEGLQSQDVETIRTAFAFSDAQLRIQALRVAERSIGSDQEERILDALLELTEDPDLQVRRQLMFSLGAFDRERARRAMLELVLADSGDPIIRLALASGIKGHHESLIRSLLESRDQELQTLDRLLFVELAASWIATDRSRIDRALELAHTYFDQSSEEVLAILDGVLLILERRGTPPAVLNLPPDLLSRTERSGALTARLERLANRLRWSQIDLNNAEADSPLTPLPEAYAGFEERGAALFPTCAVCHGVTGEGIQGLAPPLRNSQFLDSDSALVRIIRDGLTGALQVDGQEWDLTMPGHSADARFDHVGVASLITWLRRQWGHRAPPISAETVEEIFQRDSTRKLPWTAAELFDTDSSESAKAASAFKVDRLEADHSWIDLFDGTSLKGWSTQGGRAQYRVEGDSIVGQSVPNSPNTFLCTDRSFSDFELQYEFKVDPALNSGVQIRSRVGEDGIVRGLQIEIDVDLNRQRFWSAGIYEEGGRGWLADLAKNREAREAALPHDWNRVRVRAIGGSIETWINDVPAAKLWDTKALEGIIGLQVHGVGTRQDPLEVRWRKIRLLPLDQKD